MVDTGVRMFMGYNAYPEQTFYCILQQPSEPTVSYIHMHCGSNTSYDVFMNGKTHYSI